MLSNTERRIWKFMREFQEERSKPPTLQQIADNVEGLTWKTGPMYHMNHMVGKGWVEVTGDPGTSRRYQAVRPEPVNVEDNLVAHFVPTERL